MDFARVLESVCGFLDQRGFRYAVIEGLGLAAYGMRPEHLAAMKVLAMKNDPARTFQELTDIRFLLKLPGVDADEVRDYFERHGLEERYSELQATL